MSAIYQRARPIRWDEVVGQQHVKDVLRAALEQGRVGHAYLFSGPRGVGKTTTARLIAMTANCHGPAPRPCGECESCLAVRAGAHPDVLEIDAASNNSVDDVRDLREKVSLAAMRGGKKIYILDEAHMMSRAAFNALLKTLEEPPSHVIFILATTEPEKIIPTILSRCQHYRFRRLSPEEIAGKLAGLAEKEGVRAEAEALQLIGRLADGAMRDGESLLERMLAAGTAVTRTAVEEALGLPPGERVRSMAAALVLGDAGAALQGAAQLYRDGFAARTVVEGLVAALGAALHAELGLDEAGSAAGARLEGADVPRLLKLQAALDAQEARFSRSADQQSLELALTHALLAADGGGAGSAATPVSAATTAVPTEIAQRLNRLEKELASLRALGSGPGAAMPAAPAGVADFDPAARRGAAPVREVAAQALGHSGAGQAAAPAVQGSWTDVVRQASIQLKAFLKPARMHAEPGYVSLSYDDKNAFHARQVAGKFDDVAKLVVRVFGPVTFELIAPEGSRKQTLGSGAGSPAPQPAAPATPSRPEEPPAGQQVSAPGRAEPGSPEVAPFDPAPRRTVARGPAFEPVAGAAPASPGPGGSQAAATHAAETQVAGTLASGALRPAAQRAGVATLDAPPPRPAAPERRVPPPSPDDVAPAPLPARAPAPWDSGHAADAAPESRELELPESRELYVVEAISEEPDWGEIGGRLAGEIPPDLGDSPFAESSSARPRPAAPPPRAEPGPAAGAALIPAGLVSASGRPADIRAHPMYEHIKGRFSGRVREIGKNRNVVAAAATDLDDEGES